MDNGIGSEDLLRMTGGGTNAKTRGVVQLNNPTGSFRRAAAVFIISSLCVTIPGCSSWVSRMFVRSLERITVPIDPAPNVIDTPYLENAELAASWVGHATTIIQIHDKLFMTDPLLTKTVGIVLKRYVMPGLDVSTLPKVDYTFISHTHFDHFSFGSLSQLPKDGVLLLPLGAIQYTPDFGFRSVHEMDPWEVVEEDGVRITAVPVQHFSGRYGFERAWHEGLGYTGYVFEYRGYTVFFGGDTGYDPMLFKEIGRRFDIDLAIIPIGPGSSREIGGRIHVHPGGALEIFQDVRARYMLPMHHKTLFYGSDDDPSQSIRTLRQLAAERGISDRIIDLDIGQQRIIVARSLPASSPQ